MQLKPEVSWQLNPEILSVVGIVEAAYSRYGVPLVITSGSEPCTRADRKGCHLINSEHYKGNAFDFRSKGMPNSVKQNIIAQLRATLPGGFRLIFERPGTTFEHFHLEYEPESSQLAYQVLSFTQPIMPRVPYTGGGEDYDRDPGIPIEAPLPGGYMVPVMSGETWNEETILLLTVGAILLIWWTLR